ncbi:MAG: phosphopentomutase [Clostridia bacterium]|nr:phosphopentomutase [Clostridia bacterium]
MKRVFLIVLDSVGIGEMPDADKYGDKGSNTVKTCFKNKNFSMPNMKKMGLFNIDGMDYAESEKNPTASFARMSEMSNGKDTIIGHWEIAGIESEKPLPTYPNGFPKDVIEKFEKLTGRKILCNKPYSGTEVLKDYGKESVETGKLIVYTSADSVFQIAAHEDVVPVDELYKYCEIARKMLCEEHAVGRVIARPFVGEFPNYTRTTNRHDFALAPPEKTMLDFIKESGKEVIAVGKISDIFAGCGVTEKILTKGNADGINKTLEIMDKDFEGLCFVNLVDFDMLYGHRNNVDGYASALSYFDEKLNEICSKLKSEDILIITADHGCDPGTKSTDHSREYTPMIIFGENIKKGVNLGTRKGFADTGATVLEYLGVKEKNKGNSFLNEVIINSR